MRGQLGNAGEGGWLHRKQHRKLLVVCDAQDRENQALRVVHIGQGTGVSGAGHVPLETVARLP